MRLNFLITLLGLLATTVSAQQALSVSVSQGTVVLHMEGFNNIKGKAMCAMFTEDKWLDSGYGSSARILDNKATCEFRDIPYDTYGIAAFHDKDNDDKFDRFLGFPTEEGCFSNNAPATFGPPSFNKARFIHDKPRTVLVCKID